ncbi:CUB domain-containing protein 2 isoform X1 [Oryzias melastigma]|uniref:CUB domain containing protein 2 n=2 Tax=Oryzias melastigma TaxID=30732 RepID=A0A3B3C3H4_ORYME|nr:CUB domain-containing protein 2 isoform X1 [Oryzias melastigma]
MNVSVFHLQAPAAEGRMALRTAVLALLLLVFRASSKKGVKCGGILSASSGNISSPNFPGLYPYNLHCSWLMVVPEGSSVLLSFHHFELEHHDSCAYDYVKIYNGVSEDEGNLLGKFCGDAPPPRFTSSWNVMSLIFHSDRHVAFRGFSAGYSKDMCGGVLTGLSGVISSPGYPQEYSNNADCSWTVQVSNASVVTFVFLDFQLENNEGCNFDFVSLFDGSTLSHQHLGKFCGGEKPPNVITTSNQLLVVFKSDFNIGGRGFKAYYYSGECQQVLSAISGNFSSPHYPHIYPNNINCHWSISLAAGYRIKLFFPVMDLEDRNRLSDQCDYDSVAVHDGNSEADALLGRWCGREQPPFILSKGNKLLVVLSTDRTEAHRGFSASYLGVVPVNVSCTRSEFTILIPQQSLPQLDRESIYLGNPSCTAQLTSTSYKILAQFVNCGTASQKHRNITMLVNKLYIDFSDGKQQSVQEYKVQCDAQRKVASVSIISAEERRLEEQALQTASHSPGYAALPEAEPHDLSDIVFISICVLAVILMVIAIVWLVLL